MKVQKIIVGKNAKVYAHAISGASAYSYALSHSEGHVCYDLCGMKDEQGNKIWWENVDGDAMARRPDGMIKEFPLVG